MARLLIIYHYFYPDDVVSSLHFTQLAEGLVAAGHDVDVLTSNRICHQPDVTLPAEEHHGRIKMHRVQRRRVNRASFPARTAATAGFLLSLTLRLLRLQRAQAFDRIIIGTDPPLFFVIAAVLRRLRLIPEVILWSFDLYPEAVAAAGKMSGRNPVYRLLLALSRFAYRRIDHTVSIGPCMSRLIAGDSQVSVLKEIIPWSFLEGNAPAPFPMEKNQKFSELSFLYAGNLGLAHSAAVLNRLINANAPVALHVQISGRGQKFGGVPEKPESRTNRVSVLPFVDESGLPARLSGADVHIVTLESAWSGVVVPSKFFSALAFGRPVLFFGPESSAIAQWIKRYDIGWVAGDDMDRQLQEIVSVFSRQDQRAALQERCFATYQQQFSRQAGLASFRQLVSGGDRSG